MSNGSGFNTPITWFYGIATPDWADIGDFDGDGKDDIAWYRSASGGKLEVIKTNSSGTGHSGATTWFTGFATPNWAGVGDFNGDGKDDIAWYLVANGGKTEIVTTNGTGTGHAGATTWFSDFATPDWAGIGDFDGSGKDDIAWYRLVGGGKLEVIKTNTSGTGHTGATTWFTGFSAPNFAAAADFNGDVKTDLAWYLSATSKLEVLPTNSTGTGPTGTIQWLTGFGAPSWAWAG